MNVGDFTSPATVDATALLDQCDEGVARLERALVFSYANAAFARLAERPQSAIAGARLADLLPEWADAGLRTACERTLQSGEPGECRELAAPTGARFRVRVVPADGGVHLFFRETTAERPAETTLRAGDERFRDILMDLPWPIGFIEHDGTVVFVNHSFVRTLGYTRKEVPDLAAWWNTAYPDSTYRAEAQRSWNAAAAAAAAHGHLIPPQEHTVTGRDGCVRRVAISGLLRPDGMLVSFEDITKRRKAEDQATAAHTETLRLLADAGQSGRALLSVIEDQKAAEDHLRHTEERYRRLVETSLDWVWETDPTGRFSYSSPRVLDLLGYRPEEVVGRSGYEFMAPADAARSSTAFSEFVARRQPIISVEVNYRHRDGRNVVVEVNGTPVFAPDGSWSGYHGTGRDITARRSTEQTMRLRGAALEAAANAIMITDRAGRIEWSNPAFEELTGWTTAEAVGHNPRDLLNSNQQDQPFYADLWNTILAGKVWRGELSNLRHDGSLRIMDETVTPLRNERGEIAHFIAILQDVTDRKELESHLRQSQRMEAIGTLAGGVAHDLNNILAPMMFVSALLANKLHDPKDQEKLAIIQAGVRRGSEIIRQLLTFSRGQEGERSLVQPVHIIKEMAVMMRETFPREIEIQLHTPDNGWPVLADPTQLHQVLLNLSVNARDAMPKGGVLQISTENMPLAAGDPILGPAGKPGSYVALVVRDTGHGIPAEVRPRIFDPFFTTKPIGKGTGLGLSTVQGIVHSHGGFITVDSTPGKGTTFRVYLPAVPEGTVAPFDVIPASLALTVQPATILIVDDEENVRNTLRLVLESQNYRVLTASQGAEGLARYLEHRSEIRLVLTDLMMPVMNGHALIRSLRVIDPGLPIIASTGLPDPGERQELGALGVSEIVPKPCEASAVIGAVERALNRA